MKYLVIPLIIIIIVVGGFLMLNKKNNDPIASIKSLSYGYSTGRAINANVQYDIECKEKCIAKIKLDGVAEEDAKEVELDENKIKELISIFNNNKVYKWDGFQKSDKHVLDGNSFHFYLHEQNDRGISATGYMMYPKNYKIVRDKLDEFFQML